MKGWLMGGLIPIVTSTRNILYLYVRCYSGHINLHRLGNPRHSSNSMNNLGRLNLIDVPKGEDNSDVITNVN